MFAACAGDAGDAGDACAACAGDADDADDAGDADGDHETRVDAFRDARLKLVSASETAAAVVAVAAETVVEAPARGAQLSPVRERCSSWRADSDYEKRVDAFRDARLKLVSASETAAAVVAVAAETVVEAPARGAQLSPVRERCSSWRVTTAPAKACTVPAEKTRDVLEKFWNFGISRLQLRPRRALRDDDDSNWAWIYSEE